MEFTSKFVGFSAMMNELEALEINIKSDAVYIVGSNVEYAIHQELGTRNMAAQPHLRPAVREAERKIPQFAEQAGSTDELIKLIALYIERKAAEKAPVDTGNLQASYKAVRVK